MATLNRNLTGLSNFARPNANAVTSQVEQLARQLADQIVNERERARTRTRNGKIYSAALEFSPRTSKNII